MAVAEKRRTIRREFDFQNPNYTPEYKRRADNLQRIRSDKGVFVACMKHYSKNCIAFIEDWLVTFDPRKKKPPKLVPFILFRRQKDYIKWLIEMWENSSHGLCEKSRDMGVTYLNMAFSIWMWRFHEGKIGFGSRKQDLVDRIGDPDSIFEKGRIMLRYLPAEFRPHGFDIDKHTSFLKIIDPNTGAAITGEAGDNIGRGGRNSVYFKDESAHYERPQLIDAALSQNTDVQIDCSSVNGLGNPFHQKRFSYPEERVFIFDWKQDPRKDDTWYDRQVEDFDPMIIAQEIDRDYGAAVENVVIPARWINAAVEFDIQASGEIQSGLDVCDEGRDANAQVVRHGSVLVRIETWKRGDTGQSTRTALLTCSEMNCTHFKYDPTGVGAGVKAELANQEGQPLGQGINAKPVWASGTPTEGWFIEPDVNRDIIGKENKEAFLNRRAQMWWHLRQRFENTYRHVTKDEPFDNEEMISIPDDKLLIAELAGPTYKLNANGKIQIEAKDRMKERGLPSPNLADATCIAYAPEDEIMARAGTW